MNLSDSQSLATQVHHEHSPERGAYPIRLPPVMDPLMAPFELRLLSSALNIPFQSLLFLDNRPYLRASWMHCAILGRPATGTTPSWQTQ